jgi:hypothetical protein
MNKNIKIERFCLIDYSTCLDVVKRYCEIYGRSRTKLEWEKDMFDLTNDIYFLEIHKNSVRIEIDNHLKRFWVKVSESKTQYTFKIWYA